jgi:nitroreductase
MDLYSSIFTRKSTRKFDMNPLPAGLLNEMEEAITKFKPLYPNVPVEHRFTQKAKAMIGLVSAPHYLIISGHMKTGELENAGFIFQQLILWLDARDIGSCWLGTAKDAVKNTSGKDIIAIAFGKGAEPVHRAADEFNRKPIADITDDPSNPGTQAAYLAPSGINTQPWYFEKAADKILVYKQRMKPPISLIYKLTDLDMGIALCHYALSCQKDGRRFEFTRQAEMPPKAGYVPFGEIK